jgi:hypothetical protein
MKLKSVLIVCCALMVVSKSSLAQLKTEIGVKGGLNISGLALSSDGKLSGAKYNNLMGFHGGAYALLRFSKLGIQPEILFSKQGQNYTTPNYSNLRTDLNYINVPVMIKYYLGSVVNLQAGPQIGFLVSAKGDLIQIISGGQLGQAVLNQDLKPYLNSTDLSFAFGAGLDLPFGLNMNLRYNLGLSNINKYKGGSGSTDTPSFSTAYTRNQVLQFSVGYRFLKLGK